MYIYILNNHVTTVHHSLPSSRTRRRREPRSGATRSGTKRKVNEWRWAESRWRGDPDRSERQRNECREETKGTVRIQVHYVLTSPQLQIILLLKITWTWVPILMSVHIGLDYPYNELHGLWLVILILMSLNNKLVTKFFYKDYQPQS